MKQVHLEIMGWVWKIRESAIKLARSLPFWSELQSVASSLLRPVYALSKGLLEKFSFLKRIDWLLEIGSIRRRSAVLTIIILGLAFWKGISITELGHIATDSSTYPMLAALSVYSPYLGVIAAIVYGVADIIQKIFNNDIYAAASFSLNHFSALLGYVIAYSATVSMGLLPGILSRIARRGTRLLFARTSTDTADGAATGLSTQSFIEWMSSIAGAASGGYFVMHEAAPILEEPAFMMRPDPDNSCFVTEVQILKEGASDGAIGGGLGAAVTDDTERPPDDEEMERDRLYDAFFGDKE